jgi:2-amino-4-hydroxy-6-hydroxymethyldihydropteridine diphosphokinase
MVTCYLGIGSNFGDRRRNIKLAIKKVNCLKGTKVIKVSKVIEAEPQGTPSRQRKFLNAVLKIKTNLKATTLLKRLQDIEEELGRPKKHPRNDPRTIDLDILFYADTIIDSNDLQVPHPRMFEREFVMRPLLEVI